MDLSLQNILQQASKLQSEMEKMKDEVKRKVVTAESGGGMINVKMNGEYKLLELKISKELINTEEIEMLEDLIVAAINKATKDVEQTIQSQLQNMAGGFPKIPGLF